MHVSWFWTVSAYANGINEPVLMIFSLIYCFRRSMPRYMKSFPVYTIGNFAADFLALVFFPKIAHKIYFGFALYELIYFTYFLTAIFRLQRAKVVLWVLASLCLICSIILVLKGVMNFELIGINGIMMLCETITLILGCAEYIREKMVKPDVPDLTKEPAFWMIWGMLCYFLTLICTTVFSGLADVHQLRDTEANIWAFTNYLQLISTAFYITAMVCVKKQK